MGMHRPHAVRLQTYMAPECFSKEYQAISEKADIYSLGVILWAMITGRVPWQEFHYAAIMYQVAMQHERLPIPDDPDMCPPSLASLLRQCWAVDPNTRPGAGDVVKRLSLILVRLQEGRDISSKQLPRIRSPTTAGDGAGAVVVVGSDGSSGGGIPTPTGVTSGAVNAAGPSTPASAASAAASVAAPAAAPAGGGSPSGSPPQQATPAGVPADNFNATAAK